MRLKRNAHVSLAQVFHMWPEFNVALRRDITLIVLSGAIEEVKIK